MGLCPKPHDFLKKNQVKLLINYFCEIVWDISYYISPKSFDEMIFNKV